MLQLRDYQKTILNKLAKSCRTNNKILLSLPTGAGKTIMMYEWAHHMAQKNKRTVIIVDREELIEQTFALDPHISVLKAQSPHPFIPERLIQLVMLQTGYSRISSLLDLDADYIFFDEIHNYYDGQMIRAVCDSMPNAKIIGVTATPIDSKGYLLEGFDDYIGDIQTKHLIDQGYLVRPVYYAPQDYNLNLGMIRVTSGDYNVEDLERLLIKEDDAKLMLDEWRDRASDRQTVVFCSSVRHAQFLANYFQKNGVSCEAIWSTNPDRTEIVAKYKLKLYQILFNVGILVAGFDDPPTSCIVFANPTRVLRRYLQQAGRGLRTHSSKKDCLMLDFANVTQQHGFCDDLRFYKSRQDESSCPYKDCPECGAIVIRSAKQCPYCGYEFGEDEETISLKIPKKKVQQLEKALSLQQELKNEIDRLVMKRGYKQGYRWFLFIDCLKTKRPTESSIQFFKRKITKIRRIEQRNYNLAALRYD